MAKKAARGLTSQACIVALRGRFAAPAFAFFEQVANGTGYGAKRWADAVAMGIWPSRGLLIHGFEIKVGRGDWLRELKRPEKSEAVQKFCDRWWIVAPAGMIEASELPPTWGLIEVTEKGKTKAVVDAPPLKAEPLTRDFVAAMLRRHHEGWALQLKAEHRLGEKEGAANGAGDLARRLEYAESAHDTLVEKVELFEEKSGVQIQHAWKLGNIGEAVRALSKDRHHSLADDLSRDAAQYQRVADRLREEIKDLRAIEAAK